MPRNAIENPAEQLAERLLKLSDRRVELSDEASKNLSDAIRQLDEVQHEIDLATEAKETLLERQSAMQHEAEELRTKQKLEDEASIMVSAVADRKLTLFAAKIEEADRYVAELNKTYTERWHHVRHVAKVIFTHEQQRRSATITEVSKLICDHPTFVQGALANAPCLKGLAVALWNVTNVTGPTDRYRGDPATIVPTARQLLEALEI